jgi:hypothetical protein
MRQRHHRGAPLEQMPVQLLDEEGIALACLNAGRQARLAAGARHERTLPAVACRPGLGRGQVTRGRP